VHVYWLVAALSVGVAVGGFIVWVVLESRESRLLTEIRTRARVEAAEYQERLLSRQREIEDLAAREKDQGEELERLRTGLKDEVEARAKAMERAEQIPGLLQKLSGFEEEQKQLIRKVTELSAKRAELETLLQDEQKSSLEKISLLTDAKQKLEDTFRALAADALRSNNQSFLDLAKERLEKLQTETTGELDQRKQAVEELVTPLKDLLEKYDQQVRRMEETRAEAYGGLKERLETMAGTQERLQIETGNLARALRSPQVRGRWGEITLRKVVELAGMSPYCDFVEQETAQTESGRLRPDLIVKLPAGKNIVVDSKAPLNAYLDSLESGDEETRKARLQDHARRIRQHLQALSSKAYWEQFQPSPEFVVLFLPGETFFSAALEQDPSLIEEGVKQAVILATPTTLIALLRAVAYGWRQELIAENAKAISDLGRTLYERLGKLSEYFEDLRRSLERSVQAYNKAVGSLEGRVLVAGRRFKELGAGTQEELLELPPIDEVPRALQAPELLSPAREDEEGSA
jgi:DNA recombination protein RmuC